MFQLLGEGNVAIKAKNSLLECSGGRPCEECVLDFKSEGSLFLPPIRYCVEFGLRVAVASASVGGERGVEEDGAYLGRINVSTDLP